MTGARVLLCVLAPGLLFSALQPTFRTGARLVEISVVVDDRNGAVANLHKQNFQITERGKPRAISIFSMTSARGAAAPALPAHTFSNLIGAPRGVTVILFDRLNTFTGVGAQPYEEHPQWQEQLALSNARQHVLGFLEELDSRDRVAIYSLGRTLDVLSDFSSDRARLRSIVEKYQPISLTHRDDADPLPVHVPDQPEFSAAIDRERQREAALVNRTRAQTTMEALAAIAAHLAAIPGRKNLVWLTADVAIPSAAGRLLSRAQVAIYPVDVRGLLPEVDLTVSDDKGQGSVFGRRPGQHPQGPTPPGQQTMTELAAETGGRAFLNTNDLTSAIRSAVEDAVVTYTLGFYVEESDLDGKFHEIKVRVDRPHDEVRAPHGYFALASEPDPSFDAVASPLESSAVGLTARVDRKADAVTVTGVIHLAGLELPAQGDLHSGAVEVNFVQQDSAGRVLDRAQQRYDLHLDRAQYAKYLKSGVIFRGTIQARAGLATLRVVVSAGARLGSLIIPADQLPGR